MKMPHIAIWSGAMATATMTLALFELQKRLPLPEKSKLPPATITGDFAANPLDLDAKLNADQRVELTMAAHFGYGIGCATIYALATEKLPAPPVVKGTFFGVVVWAGSYFGLLPTLDSRASGFKMGGARNLQMFLAHLVWGATLGYADDQLRRMGRSTLAAR